jgi:V8-like Glu-specific endopeptidase
MTTTASFKTSTRFLVAMLLCSSMIDVVAADSPAKTGNLRTLVSSEQIVDAAVAGPMLQDEVDKTLQDRPALSKLPDAKIELARFFDRDVDIRYDEKTGALVIESKLTLNPLAEAPSIAGDMLDPRLLTDPAFVKQFMKGEFEGSIPDHLAFSAKPTFVQDDASIVIAEGSDIATNIFGADDRKIFHSHHYPLSTVGRVENAKGVCTGTMVGRRLMLTAGHCVNWINDKEIGWLKFTPSYYDGEAPFGVAWATKIIYWEKPDPSDGLTDHETAFDYVIAVLDHDIGNSTGYTGYKTYNSQWNNLKAWQNIGYPGPLTSAQRPVISSGGAITSVQSEFSSSTGQTGYVLGNYIDTQKGHSGGPVWGWWAGEFYPRVVGDISSESLHPGPTTNGDNEAGGGPALSALIGWARSHYQ